MNLFTFLSLLTLADPYAIEQYSSSQVILQKAKNVNQAIELHAIAFTESRFQEDAVSETGDYGLFQINCNVWWKHLNYTKRSDCRKDMMNPNIATITAMKIIQLYRKKYDQCRGTFVYLCYNGGPGWIRSKNKEKIIKYREAIIRRFAIIDRRFRNYFEKELKNTFKQHFQQCRQQEAQKSQTQNFLVTF